MVSRGGVLTWLNWGGECEDFQEESTLSAIGHPLACAHAQPTPRSHRRPRSPRRAPPCAAAAPRRALAGRGGGGAASLCTWSMPLVTGRSPAEVV